MKLEVYTPMLKSLESSKVYNQFDMTLPFFGIPHFEGRNAQCCDIYKC